MPAAVVSVHPPSPAILFLHLTSSVIFAHTADCRAAWGLVTWTGCLQTVMYSHLGISSEIRRPHLISGPSSPHCVDSAVPSLPPFVHGFPSLIDAIERARSGEIVFLFLIVRVFSSTLLPGFLGPESLVLSVNLPPSVPSRFGVSSSSQFAIVAGNRRRQNRRASLGKTHHLPISRPASCQVSAPDIRPRLVTSARPPPQHHLAGSLCATYMGSASCFLPTPHF